MSHFRIAMYGTAVIISFFSRYLDNDSIGMVLSALVFTMVIFAYILKDREERINNLGKPLEHKGDKDE